MPSKNRSATGNSRKSPQSNVAAVRYCRLHCSAGFGQEQSPASSKSLTASDHAGVIRETVWIKAGYNSPPALA